MPATSIAKLALEDGTIFTGRHFGFAGTTEGEIVFNTSMTGYQEILTDPSYAGQVVTMTYPLIGNYGINREDMESKKPQVAGFIIKELAPAYSNYRADLSLEDYLKQNNIVAIAGIDTRALVRKLRIKGSMNGVLSSQILDDEKLLARVKKVRDMSGADLVKDVKPTHSYAWDEGQGDWSPGMMEDGEGLHVVALDCGAKQNILRNFIGRGIKVTVLPARCNCRGTFSSTIPTACSSATAPAIPPPSNTRSTCSRKRSTRSPLSASASAISYWV